LLKSACEKERLIMFARAVSTPEESLLTVALSDATPDMADMRTMVLVGSRQTRLIPRENAAPIVYTPRSMR
jgi:precorrin-3B C17-methyltransferase